MMVAVLFLTAKYPAYYYIQLCPAYDRGIPAGPIVYHQGDGGCT